MGLAAFVISHYRSDAERIAYLERTIDTIFAQSDPNWIIVIADDCSPYVEDRSRLLALRDRDPQRIHFVENLVQAGPGAGRNKAIRRAAALGASIILHQDDDDLAHPRRVEVTRAIFRDRPAAEFVYSGFRAIDGNDRKIARADIRLDMLEVLEELYRGPLEGRETFARMTGDTGFIATLATVAVPVAIALAFPFPTGLVSEDHHTWMRIAASGAEFVFAPEIPTDYRIVGTGPSDLGVNGRDRWFLLEKAHNDIEGFEQGVVIAMQRGALGDAEVPGLTRRFLERLAVCVERQGEHPLAERLRSRAICDDLTDRLRLVGALMPARGSHLPPLASSRPIPRKRSYMQT